MTNLIQTSSNILLSEAKSKRIDFIIDNIQKAQKVVNNDRELKAELKSLTGNDYTKEIIELQDLIDEVVNALAMIEAALESK